MSFPYLAFEKAFIKAQERRDIFNAAFTDFPWNAVKKLTEEYCVRKFDIEALKPLSEEERFSRLIEGQLRARLHHLGLLLIKKPITEFWP